MSHMEHMEQGISVHLCKWLSVPHNLSTIALYSSQNKVSLPSSIVEEFKVAKFKMYMTMRDSDDQVIHDSRPDIKTGCKCQVSAAVGDAES